jgi:acyl-coenzyme A synthetase/AMP-(fatty) acid ligase
LADLASVARSPDAPGFWMYSSGTTGKPKGVVHAQRTAFAATAVLGDLMGVTRGDRVFCSSKLFFAWALGHLMFGTLQAGATAVLYPGWPDAKAVAGVIDRHRPTIVLSVPTFYRNMLRDGVTSEPAFKDVRYFLSAGEKLPRSLFDQWKDRTGLDERSEAVFKDGWYCTNDIFTFDAQGFFEYQGRADDMLKISGQWVSPAEIEEHVLKHPNVSEAAVVGVPNEDGLIRLALFMVAPQVSDRPVFEKELQDALVASLSIYKCPRRVFYVDSMPVTATGKLQRYALRQIAQTDVQFNEDRV